MKGILEKISTKFILMAIVTLTLAVSLTGALSYSMAKSVLIRKLKSEDLLQLANLKAERIESRLGKALETSLGLARDPVVVAWFQSYETNYDYRFLVQKRLDNLIDFSDYYGTFAANILTKNYHKPKGEITYLDETDQRHQWFYKIIREKQPINININLDPNSGKTYLFINALLHNCTSNSYIYLLLYYYR